MAGCDLVPVWRSRGGIVVRKLHGFTLVELLVVIGIIAVLLGLVLVSLARARESARSVQCLSNLRSLGQAMTAYVQRYERFPRCAVEPFYREDWFHWSDTATVHLKKKGGIGEFLNDGGSTSSSVWVCPSDDMETHLVRTGNDPKYRFSYSVNFVICTYAGINQQPGGRLSAWPTEGLPPLPRTMSYAQVKQPENKILIIDESSETIDDGAWAWQWGVNPGRNILSNRHDKKSEKSGDYNAGYGNAGFADGHAERIPRIRTFNQKYYDPFLPGSSPLPPPAVTLPGGE
jgi:prepilin-type N-terminal cleavage/methylation domain-containing protein/prepilin-type processing-associated H-X9-DG protein